VRETSHSFETSKGPSGGHALDYAIIGQQTSDEDPCLWRGKGLHMTRGLTTLGGKGRGWGDFRSEDVVDSGVEKYGKRGRVSKRGG